MNEDKVRIDKWLWAVRIFKTRQLAAEACKKGNVKVEGQKVKSSRMVSVGDKIVVRKEGFDWEYGVAGCIEKRVGAKLVAEYRTDLTSEEKLEEIKTIKAANACTFKRPRGAGRPTKKQRREIDKVKGL